MCVITNNFDGKPQCLSRSFQLSNCLSICRRLLGITTFNRLINESDALLGRGVSQECFSLLNEI